MATPSLQPSAQPIQADDEIDLGQLVASLGRRKRLIAAVTGATVGLTGVLTGLQKPIWEGEFQIVLASKDSGQSSGAAALLAQNPGLAGLAGISGAGKGNQLETEVKILQSPSVLKPVYDFVRAQKRSNGIDVEEMRYDAWVKANGMCSSRAHVTGAMSAPNRPSRDRPRMDRTPHQLRPVHPRLRRAGPVPAGSPSRGLAARG